MSKKRKLAKHTPRFDLVGDQNKRIPFGKYVGKPLKYVKRTNEDYYAWMIKEDLVYKWKLYKLRIDRSEPHI